MVSDDSKHPRLAVSGWRGMTNPDVFAEAVMDFIIDHGLPGEIITGGARGADSIAADWARKQNIPLRELRPQYQHDGDRAAPLRRNSEIVARCTHMLAFPSQAHGSGTQDAIRKARAAGKVVIVREL